MSTTISILINIFVLIFALIAILTSIGIFYLIFHYQHQRNTSMILICNTLAAILFISIILFEMYVHYLYGDFHANISLENWWCYCRGYLLHVGACLVHHSYFLQALFRFFRVVLYKHQHFQTVRFMLRLIVHQWLIDFLAFLPIVFLGYLHYIPDYYYCEILLTDTQAMMITGTITSAIPITLISLIYRYILYDMKKKKAQSVLQNRQQANQRDATVVRRIVILMAMLVSLSFPTMILWDQYIFTGYVNRIGYRLGWSLFVLSLSILPTISLLLTPPLRKSFILTCRWNVRIQPTIVN